MEAGKNKSKTDIYNGLFSYLCIEQLVMKNWRDATIILHQPY